MWTIHFSTVFGFMIGIEYINPEDTGGVSGVAIDIGIFRVMFLKDEEEA